MPPKPLVYNATLVERQDLTDALSVFKIRPDEAGDDGFVPGQYVTIGLNNEERLDLGSVRRPMSIASAPEEGGVYELYVRWVAHPESDNPLTHLLWKVKAGDRIYLRPKAVGHFTVAHSVGDDDPRLRVLVAAGTGLAPFVSMVRSERLRDAAADLSRWTVLHGASYPADLGYRDELTRLAAENRLRYFATISRPKEAAGWEGDVGRVEDYFLPERLGELDRRLGLDDGGLVPATGVVFICGLQGTIGRIIERLVPRGFVPDNKKLRRALEVDDDVPSTLFFEQYDTTPVIDLADEALMTRLRGELRSAVAAAG